MRFLLYVLCLLGCLSPLEWAADDASAPTDQPLPPAAEHALDQYAKAANDAKKAYDAAIDKAFSTANEGAGEG